MKKGLFSHSKIAINSINSELITTKTASNYYIMYKMNKAGRRKKVSSFMGDFLEKFKEMTPENTKTAFIQILMKVAKLEKEKEAIEFINEHCMYDGKISSDKIMKLMKSDIEITIDFSEYLNIGLKLIIQFVESIKSRAAAFAKEYGKKQEHFIFADEINHLLVSNFSDPKEKWKVVAFMEYFLLKNSAK